MVDLYFGDIFYLYVRFVLSVFNYPVLVTPFLEITCK